MESMAQNRHNKGAGAARWHNALMASVASGSLMLASCSLPGTGADSESAAAADSMEAAAAAESAEGDEERGTAAPSDIGMTVRSVVDAINVGEPIDSTDYNFAGVLTDGTGMPLFTDYDGLPGEWRVDVVNAREVRIRTLGTGDLLPESLVRYLARTLHESPDSDNELREVEVRDEGDSRIEEYAYGRTSVLIETRPTTLPTGEVGPALEITIRPDTILPPAEPPELARTPQRR